ncbi:hypothetical protein [Candidatus Poriferisocius sp.]|uniref:hypothetical protein n=1 Tax=Candidatus Poriferisocius sp. TaxID=3101276 RepID=UPI003B51D618
MTDPANPAEPAPEKSLLRRLSPYLAIAVIAAIVVIVLVVTGGGNGDDDGDDASVDTAPPAAEEPADDDSTDEDVTDAGEGDTAAPAADEPEDDDSTGGGDADAGEGDTPAEEDVTPAADPPDPPEPAEPEYPGIGSQAALANPHCDPETGRVRVPILDAPPCVVEWPEGADNGGSTAPGVTADSIVMVVRVDAGQTEIIDDVGGIPRAWKDVVDIYNEHFELWGRQVQLEFIDSSGSSEVAQRADATRAVNDFEPFFTHDATTDGDGRAIFEAEMAARGVIVWGAIVSWQETQDQPGFRWSGLADGRVTLLHVLEYVGKRVAGDPVQWAGDDSLIGEPRRIGMVYTDRWDRDFIDEQAALQGFELVEAVSYDEGAESTQRQERARVIAARMKDAGVTTVIAGTDNLFTGTLTKAATEQQWFPEWIITGYGAHDAAFFARGYDQQQWAHAFGPGPIGVRVDGVSTAYQLLFEWHHGRPPGSLAANQALSVVRWPLTCIHLTGPNLTPESFSEGCFAMPPTGGAYCDCVTTTGATFGDSLLPWTDYTAFDDMAEKWWDPTFEYTTPSGFTQVGAYLVVDGGRRYAVGGWPDGQPNVFDPDAAVFRLADYPPNEVLPSYER